MLEDSTRLPAAIAKAIGYKDSPPPNEACTGQWIIMPLLYAAGYEVHEVQPQAQDNGGKYPDYTVLPGTDYTWFLEAKAWSVPLNDQHVQQTLVYAFTNNRRWAVLTNGREWRLYDNKIDGPLDHKLVAQVRMEDQEEIARFLQAISRESMISGAVDFFGAHSRLAAVLSADLANASSPVVRAIWKALRARPGLAAVTRDMVAGYFSATEEAGVAGPYVSPLEAPKITTTLHTSSLDTIVVPARREGFLRAFLGESAWWAVRISPKRLAGIKYIAAYQVNPISAITHVAPVARIEPFQETGKYKLFFAEPAREIGHIRPGPDSKTSFLQRSDLWAKFLSPRFTSYDKLMAAKRLEEVF